MQVHVDQTQQSTESGSNKSHREQEVQGWFLVMYTTSTYKTCIIAMLTDL